MTFRAGKACQSPPIYSTVITSHSSQSTSLISFISVAMSSYRVDVGVAQVILGNEVLLKCDIPSFASDFVSVQDWVDSEGITYSRSSQGNV